MRRQISWLVIATTSAVVASFVIPLCLLVRTLAEDRASAAADQDARDAAILVAQLPDDPRLSRADSLRAVRLEDLARIAAGEVLELRGDPV